MRYLQLEEVIYIYTEMTQRCGGEAGLRDEAALEMVLNKPQVTFDGEELYPDLYTKAAVLMYALLQNKPFVAGNRQMALLLGMFLLRVNGYHVVATQDVLVELMLGIEAGTYKVDQLVSWLRGHAAPL